MTKEYEIRLEGLDELEKECLELLDAIKGIRQQLGKVNEAGERVCEYTVLLSSEP